MKKQKIMKKLSFKKEVLKDLDLKLISGGMAPETGEVNTYRCEDTVGGICGPDPSPNGSTCNCGGQMGSDTYIYCNTRYGDACVLVSLPAGGCTHS